MRFGRFVPGAHAPPPPTTHGGVRPTKVSLTAHPLGSDGRRGKPVRKGGGALRRHRRSEAGHPTLTPFLLWPQAEALRGEPYLHDESVAVGGKRARAIWPLFAHLLVGSGFASAPESNASVTVSV